MKRGIRLGAMLLSCVCMVTGCGSGSRSEIPDGYEYVKDVSCVVVSKRDKKATPTVSFEETEEEPQEGIIMTKTRSRSKSSRSSKRSSSKSKSKSKKSSGSSSFRKKSSSHRRHYYYYYSRHRKNHKKEEFAYNDRYEVVVTYEEKNCSYTFYSKGMYDAYQIGDQVTMKWYENKENREQGMLVPMEE